MAKDLNPALAILVLRFQLWVEKLKAGKVSEVIDDLEAEILEAKKNA